MELTIIINPFSIYSLLYLRESIDFLVIALAIVKSSSFALDVYLFFSYEGVIYCAVHFCFFYLSTLGLSDKCILRMFMRLLWPYNLETLSLFHGLTLREDNNLKCDPLNCWNF